MTIRVDFSITEDYGVLTNQHPHNLPGISIAACKDKKIPTIEVRDHDNDIVTPADVETERPTPDKDEV